MKKITLFVILLFAVNHLSAQDSTITYKPKVLLVTAHPDDDAIFSASVFKITHLLDGVADLALMTNGEGGYKYSTLGNYIYGKDLDKEKTGREYLPGIRKKELMAGGDIVGIRNYFFFDQQDFYYTLDANETIEKWDTEWIVKRLEKIISEGDYDFMFLLLPYEGTHGHHKTSAVLALRALSNLPAEKRPVALETFIRRSQDDPGVDFTMLDGFPLTKVKPGITFEFDRNQTFGFDDRLNYNIITNWVIAEHKSQGTMQLLMTTGAIEQYWYADINSDSDIEKTRRFFNAINKANIYDPTESGM